MQWFGIWGAHAPTFLLVLVISTTLLFALPIFLVPLHWARLFQWKIPAETDLDVYFGRCLGAFILMLEFMARSEEHTSELQSLMRSSYAVFCLKKKHKRYTSHIQK